MATPQQFTQEERDALLRFRRAQRGKTVMDVGNVIGGASAAFRNAPFTPATLPGADNLTAAERAKYKAELARILADLMESEREALASDQDYASKAIIAHSDLVKALLVLNGTTRTASATVNSQKVSTYGKLAEGALEDAKDAALSRQLGAEGQGMIEAIVGNAQQGKVLNAHALNQEISKNLAELEPARRPAYVAALNRELQASGNPALRNFDLLQGLGAVGPDAQPADLDLVMNIQGLLDEGFDAALEAEQRQSMSEAEMRDNAQKMAKVNAGVPGFMEVFAKSLTAEVMPPEMRNISAPAPDAPLDEQRAYVERATSGQQTVTDDGMVRPVLPAGVTDRMPDAQARLPSTSYAAWAKSTPRISVPEGGAVAGGMTPSGSGYSLSGPTAETRLAIQELRKNIQKQIEDLDKSALSPFEAARGRAYEAAAGKPGFQFSSPEIQRRFATRQAGREQRAVNREERAERDQGLLTGEIRGGVVDRGAAKVRSLFRKAPTSEEFGVPLDLSAIPVEAPSEAPPTPKTQTGEAPPPDLDIDRMRAAGEAPGQAPAPTTTAAVPPPSEAQAAAAPDSAEAIRRRAFEELMATPPPQAAAADEAPVLNVAPYKAADFLGTQAAAASPVATPESFFAASRATPEPADVKPTPLSGVAAGLRALGTTKEQQNAAQQVSPAPGGPDRTSTEYWRGIMPELRAEDPRLLRKRSITDAVGY